MLLWLLSVLDVSLPAWIIQKWRERSYAQPVESWNLFGGNDQNLLCPSCCRTLRWVLCQASGPEPDCHHQPSKNQICCSLALLSGDTAPPCTSPLPAEHSSYPLLGRRDLAARCWAPPCGLASTLQQPARYGSSSALSSTAKSSGDNFQPCEGDKAHPCLSALLRGPVRMFGWICRQPVPGQLWATFPCSCFLCLWHWPTLKYCL